MPHTELRVADVLDRTPWVKSLGEAARDRLYSDAFFASTSRDTAPTWWSCHLQRTSIS